MRCLICYTLVPDDQDRCPKCGDDVRQWRETDGAADRLLRDGAFRADRGELVPATMSLAEAAFLNPADPAALKALGQVLARQGDYDDAVTYLRRAVEVIAQEALPADREADAALARAEAMLDGDGAGAGGGMLRLLTDYPRNAPPEPEDAPDGAPVPEPEPAPLDQAWQAVTALESRWTAGIEAVRPVLAWASVPDEPYVGPWLYLRGLLALADGDRESAAESFRVCAAVDPSRRNAGIHLLDLAMDAGDPAPAVQFLREQGHEPDDVAVTIMAAARLRDLDRGDPEGAMRLLVMGLAGTVMKRDMLVDMLSDWAKTLTAGDGAQAAYTALDRAIALDAGAEKLHVRLAEACLKLDRNQEAVDRLTRFTETRSWAWEALFALSQVHWYGKRYAQGIAVLKRVLVVETLPPAERPGMLYRLARAHLKLEQRHEARTCLTDALGLDPEHPKARKLLAELDAGTPQG